MPERPGWREALGDADKAVEAAVQGQMAELLSPRLDHFVTCDPALALEKVRVPVLALFGGKDVQVAAEPNEQAVKAGLERGQNAWATVKTYPTANHLFQPAITGVPSEYATQKGFVPGLLDDSIEWAGQLPVDSDRVPLPGDRLIVTRPAAAAGRVQIRQADLAPIRHRARTRAPRARR